MKKSNAIFVIFPNLRLMQIMKHVTNIKLPISRFIDLEAELGELFHLAYTNKISLGELQEQGFIIEKKQDEDSTDLLLEDALWLIEYLHDDFVRKEIIENPVILDKYSRLLLGKESEEYFLKPAPNLQVKITYEKYESGL